MYHVKVLPNKFDLNGHTVGFRPHTQILKYESHEIVIFYLFIFVLSWQIKVSLQVTLQTKIFIKVWKFLQYYRKKVLHLYTTWAKFMRVLLNWAI